MKENGADLSMTDAVIASLVDMGFDFDISVEDDECDTCGD